MRFKNLSELNRPEYREVSLSTLPQEIKMTNIALEKAFKISELVLEIHKESYEWYGFTLASANKPEIIIDEKKTYQRNLVSGSSIYGKKHSRAVYP